jgi:hypothetical protein
MALMDQLVETDVRGRATIGHPNSRYLKHEEADGTIVLEPASVITDLERRFLNNAALQAQIEYAKAHPEQQRRRRKS